MSRFLTKLEVRVADNTDDGRWIVAAPLIYQSDVAKQTFIVPRGFQTDMASVVHDFLYSTHTVSRQVADSVLREASAMTQVPAWRRWIMWAGVRMFGGSHW